MTDEHILTDGQIEDAVNCVDFATMVTADDFIFVCARAIEQAVLQSPQVKQWRKDAERYRIWRDAMLSEDDGFLDKLIAALPESPNLATREDIDAAFDAAMEMKQ